MTYIYQRHANTGEVWVGGTLLPSMCEANPHWGERQMRDLEGSPITLAASSTRPAICLGSSRVASLELIRPRTTDLFFGKWAKGSKFPARGVSSDISLCPKRKRCPIQEQGNRGREVHSR